VSAIAFLPAMVYSIAFVFTGQVRDSTNYNASNYIVWIIDGVLSVTLLITHYSIFTTPLYSTVWIYSKKKYTRVKILRKPGTGFYFKILRDYFEL
jgi:hypothetical protein